MLRYFSSSNYLNLNRFFVLFQALNRPTGKHVPAYFHHRCILFFCHGARSFKRRRGCSETWNVPSPGSWGIADVVG